jgi:hypothetical protein
MLSESLNLASVGRPSEAFCSEWPSDPACSIAPASAPPAWPATAGLIILGAGVTLILNGLVDAWQANRLTLNWHDQRLVKEVIRLRNGILAELPWSSITVPYSNAVPTIDGGSTSAPAPAPASAKPASGAPEPEPEPSFAAEPPEPEDELLPALDQAVVERMARSGSSLTACCRELGVSRGSSPRYARIREVYYAAKN